MTCKDCIHRPICRPKYETGYCSSYHGRCGDCKHSVEQVYYVTKELVGKTCCVKKNHLYVGSEYYCESWEGKDVST